MVDDDDRLAYLKKGPSLSWAIDDFLETQHTAAGQRGRSRTTGASCTGSPTASLTTTTSYASSRPATCRSYLLSLAVSDHGRVWNESVIRSWLGWCVRTGRLETDPTEGTPRLERPRPRRRASAEPVEIVVEAENFHTFSWE